MICALQGELRDGTKLKIESDAAWRASQTETDGWRRPDFDDSAWSPAKVLAPFGSGPWGDPAAASDFLIPYCAGIPTRVRVIYVPNPVPIRVCQLEPGVRYSATQFDPVTGQSQPLGPVELDAKSNWQSPDPKTTHDWVLVLNNLAR